MKENYHIFSSGQLKKKNNNVVFIDSDGDKDYIPKNKIESIYVHSPVSFNTKLFKILSKNNIQLHLFSWNDMYCGSFVPESQEISGECVVRQVEKYKNKDDRLYIASKIVNASIYNMKRNLQYYDNKDDNDLSSEIETVIRAEDRCLNVDDINELMGIEASCRSSYYNMYEKCTSRSFELNERSYNPPSNELNALISYSNSLLYSSIVSSIRKTALNPSVSYLHEPGNRRFSLCLDISDIFKPVLVDRIIMRILNRKQISMGDFEGSLNNITINESARKKICREYEKTLDTTVDHPDLGRKVSYKYLLYLDVVKLKKYIMCEESFEPFKRWW